MKEKQIPYMVENKERDTFTIYVKGTKPYLELQQRINKAIELIKRSAGYKGICTQPETDTFSKILEILGDKE